MANTLHSRYAASKSASPTFARVSPSGQVETIMGPKNGTFSPEVMKDVKRAASHYAALGAENVFYHAVCALKAAVDGRLPLTKELRRQILYHSLKSDSYLPTDVDMDVRIFELQRRLNHLDSKHGKRCAEYVKLLNDPSNDPTHLLIALYTRMADMMTIHDPKTVMASRTKMPGIFPVLREGWEAVLKNYADPMLKVYCPVADWGGQTYAYRQMRDNAMHDHHPRLFQEVATEVQKRMGALENTNRFLFKVLKKMAKELNLHLIVADDYRTISRAFSEVGPRTIAVALKPFKGVGGLLDKSNKKGDLPARKMDDGVSYAESIKKGNLPVEKIHDWAGHTVITATTEQMYDVVSFLYNGGIKSVAADMDVPDLYIHQPKDYALNPKPVTNYQSVHVDVVSSQEELLPSECIVRTIEMHRWADEGGASHDAYKDSPLTNGERRRFMKRLAEIEDSINKCKQ